MSNELLNQVLEESPNPPLIGSLTLSQILSCHVREGGVGSLVQLNKFLPQYLCALWDEADGSRRNIQRAHGKDERTMRLDIIRCFIKARLVHGNVDSHDYVCNYDHDEAAAVLETVLVAVFKARQS